MLCSLLRRSLLAFVAIFWISSFAYAGDDDNDAQRDFKLKIDYYQQVHKIVSANWRPPAVDQANDLKDAIFIIKVEPNGQISTVRLNRSSGNPDYDLAIEQAIRQSVLPPLPPVFENQAQITGLNFSVGGEHGGPPPSLTPKQK